MRRGGQAAFSLGDDGDGGVVPQPRQRDPLPPNPAVQPWPKEHRDHGAAWARRPYRTVLPFTPSRNPREFRRGNFCGFRMAGAPRVTGGADDPSVIMTCLIDRYPHDFQTEFFGRYAEAGYTEAQRSLGHSVLTGEDAGEFGNGLTADQFVDSLKLQQSCGLLTDVFFFNSLGYRAKDQQASFWIPKFDPWLDRLIESRAMDFCTLGWQLDQGLQPRALKELAVHFSDRLKGTGIAFGFHWVNDANAWFDDWREGVNRTPPEHRSDFTDRFDFWRFMAGRAQWTHYQGDTGAPIDDYQEGIRLVMDSLPDGTQLDVFEISAQAQFNGWCSEAVGDQKTRLAACVTDSKGRHIGGIGGGWRDFDGTPL